MSHKGHPDCPHPTKAACERARRIELGQCQETTGDREPTPCRHWAVEIIGDRRVCGQHARSVAIRVDIERRRAAKRADLDRRLDEYVAWTAEHPSVWDQRGV
jgi:hypothetical protein